MLIVVVAAVVLASGAAAAQQPIEAKSAHRAAEVIASLDYLRKECGATFTIPNEADLRAQVYRDGARTSMSVTYGYLEDDARRAGKLKLCEALARAYVAR